MEGDPYLLFSCGAWAARVSAPWPPLPRSTLQPHPLKSNTKKALTRSSRPENVPRPPHPLKPLPKPNLPRNLPLLTPRH